MAGIARDVESHRTLERIARQEIPTAILAGHQGTGHESAREKGRTTTIIEGGDNTMATMATITMATMATITMATTVTITTVTMAIITIATMATITMEMANTTMGQVEVVAHHHIIQGHTTNNQ